MRHAALLLLLALPACGGQAFPPLLAAEAVSVMILGRGIVDIGVSALSGRDCSIVRLDRGQTYCAGRDGPAAQAYCTRTLATADCWSIARAAPPIADTPQPTAQQERYRAAPWPKTLTAQP